jgi:hypothetical protein
MARIALFVLCFLMLSGLQAEEWYTVAFDNQLEQSGPISMSAGALYRFNEAAVALDVLPANDPARTVAYGERVQYNCCGLDPKAAYRLKLTFVSDGEREQKIKINGEKIEGNVVLQKGKVLVRELDVPQKAADSGELELLIEKVSGPNAVLAGIELLSTVKGLGILDPDWKPPYLAPVDQAVPGVEQPVRSLNGTWKFTLEPPEEFWSNSVDPSEWSDIAVPGEPWMQGLEIERDKEYPYKRRIAIPEEFAGQRVYIRFDGVYSEARVWLDGELLGSHIGGFASWSVDITDKVKPGQEHWLTVGFVDPTYDISFASGYASRYKSADFDHFIGGILRDVYLVAVPSTHIERFNFSTELDDEYRDAELEIEAAAALGDARNAELRLFLKDPDGKRVKTRPSKFKIEKGDGLRKVSLAVENPLKWTAETPHLYDLEGRLYVQGKAVQSLFRKVGFREVEIRGNRFLVNGREVKLRGGNRHSISPLGGRSDIKAFDEIDARLYKEANCNYVRTSHYPTTPNFLKMCDKYGLYVEEEMDIVWLDHGAARGKLNGLSSNPELWPQFRSRLAETLERDKSHPSIVIWSLGNENVKWGTNIMKMREYARREDPTRPLKTGHNHYAGGWGTDAHLDIDSFHYPSLHLDFNKDGKPYLFDEYAHVRCYYPLDSFSEQDPGVRNFWGESLKIFWDKICDAQGAMGAAIWGTVDDVFLSPKRANGYGRWGIFDGWRRRKPEFWNTKKAYSPIRIENAPLGNPGAGYELKVPVVNRYSHTDLKDIEIVWEVGDDTGRVETQLAPGGNAGEIILPGREWSDDDVVKLCFYETDPCERRLVDRYELPLTRHQASMPQLSGAPHLSETADTISVQGDDFRIDFDKVQGQIRTAVSKGETVLTGGPLLTLTPLKVESFKLDEIAAKPADDCVEIALRGHHGDIAVDYIIRIDAKGLMEVDATVSGIPEGTYNEQGIAFLLAGSFDRFAWQREGLWSCYPDDHIGRLEGVALRRRPGPELLYRAEPKWPWSLDMKDFHQRGRDHEGYGLTADFRSSKEHFTTASVFDSKTGIGLTAYAQAEKSVRMLLADGADPKDENAGLRMNINSEWKYDLGWENYNRKADVGESASDKYRLRIGSWQGQTFQAAVQALEAHCPELGTLPQD